MSSLERIAYGTPLDLDTEHPPIPTVPRSWTALIGRVFLASIFAVSGIAKLTDPAGSIAYMQAQGIPYSEILVYLAGVAEIAGAASLLFGFLTRLGAIGLGIFLVVTTLVFHDFWSYAEPEATTQMVNFMKNLTILGGLWLLVAYGAGRYSIDGLIRRPMQP